VIKHHIITLSSDQYGCRVIQKALETLPSNLRDEIVEEIKPDIIRCVEDANGNHVIQKIVE
jgi:Pumilio-family RNA binding repeat